MKTFRRLFLAFQSILMDRSAALTFDSRSGCKTSIEMRMVKSLTAFTCWMTWMVNAKSILIDGCLFVFQRYDSRIGNSYAIHARIRKLFPFLLSSKITIKLFRFPQQSVNIIFCCVYERVRIAFEWGACIYDLIRWARKFMPKQKSDFDFSYLTAETIGNYWESITVLHKKEVLDETIKTPSNNTDNDREKVVKIHLFCWLTVSENAKLMDIAYLKLLNFLCG